MAHGLEQIHWSAPWLLPYQRAGEPLTQKINAGRSCWDALNDAPGAFRFVPQTELPVDQAYEQFIFEQQRVPTRDGLHDFFNGLVWLHFPQAKRRLNQLQAQQIAADGVLPVRGPLRDAVTVFDENAALLQAPDALWDALAVRDWPSLFITLRPLWTQTRLTLFGHALLEKLVSPRKAITAHVYRVPPGVAPAAFDAWLAQDLQGPALAGKPFLPLPLLGVPGWWPPNEHPGFYADTQVFRPLRLQATA